MMPMAVAEPVDVGIRFIKEEQPLGAFDFREQLAGVQELYFGGDMEAAIPLSGQVVGRIDAVQPVAEVIQGTMNGFYESLGHLQGYASP